jgi:hypothetical protein
MCDISFLIITNREYELWSGRTVECIHKSIKDYPIKYTYEILICSPEEISDKNVLWVKDEFDGLGHGVAANNKMFQYSQGKYIITINDDHMFPDPSLEPTIYPDQKPLKAIEFLQSDVFQNRRFKVTSIGAGWNVSVYGSTCIPSLAWPPPYPLSEELKDPKYTQVPHRHLILGYPVYERATVIKELRGFLFNPSFKHRYADNWLSFFIGENDETIQVCVGSSLQGFGPNQVSGETTENTVEQDYHTFTRLVRNFVSGDNLEYV